MMKRFLFLISILPFPLYSQFDLWNFELLWEKGAKDFNSVDSLGSFGISLAGADINQDGYSDIIIGSLPGNIVFPETLIFFGKVYIFFGGPLLDTIPDIIIENPYPDTAYFGGRFGSVIAVGDFNGDDLFDLLVRGTDSLGQEAVFFYSGIPGSISITPSLIFREDEASGYGYPLGSIANAGDINGDGYDDIIIGAPYTGPDYRGAVYIYYGGPLLDTIPDFVRYGKPPWKFGHAVTGLGDINDDGFGDFAVSAVDWPAGFWGDTGAIFVFYGGNPPDTIWEIMMKGEGPSQFFGYVIGSINSFNQGQKYDLYTRASQFPYGFGSLRNTGKIYVYFGENKDSLPDWEVQGQDSAMLGMDVTGVIIENRASILGGAPNNLPWGYITLYLGYPDADIFYDAKAFHIEGGNLNRDFAYKVGSCDVDGDFNDEILVSSYPAPDSRVWLFKYTGPVPQIAEPSLPDIKQRYLIVNPNIFNKFINIKISLPEKENIDLSVYDISGKKIKTIFRGKIKNLKTKWYPENIKSGIYFIRLKSPSFKLFKKILYLKEVNDV